MSTKASAALQPLYLKVKRHILDNIGSGKWAVSSRVPSENEIVKIVRRIAHDRQPCAQGIAR